MELHLKEALEIVKAQASVRKMTEEEITTMICTLADSIKVIREMGTLNTEAASDIDPAKAIKEKSITCVECGKAFKIITKKHLLTHGLSPIEYREKCGYRKGTPLICKGLQRERRKKMKEMKLWKRRGKTEE